MLLIANGQQYPSRNYTTESGLPHSNVYRIFQDKRGFLWFSTDYGLCSFDGKTFKSTFSDTSSELNYSIMSVSENAKGVKLVSGGNGIIQLTDSSLKKLETPGKSAPQAVLFSAEVNNKLWFVTLEEGSPKQKLFSLSDNKVEEWRFFKPGGQPVVFNKIARFGDDIIFPTSNGLYKVAGSVVQPFLHELVTENVIDVSKSSNGDYWLGLDKSIVVIKKDRGMRRYPLNNENVNDIYLDKGNNLWISLQQGGVAILKGDSVLNISRLLPFERAIVNDIFQDFEGNLWFATYGSGVYMVNSLGIFNYSFGGGKANIYCKALCGIGDGRMLIGTIGKIYILAKGKLLPLDVRCLKPDAYVYEILAQDNVLYICAAQGLITKNLLPPYNEKVYDFGALSILRDETGFFWVGSYSWLYRFSEGKKTGMPSLNNVARRYNTLIKDSKGNLWFGGGKGAFVAYPPYKDTPVLVLKKRPVVTDIAEDKLGRIWLATNHGLAYIENDTPRYLTKKDGLSSDFCTSLAIDKRGILWVGTSSGLDYMDIKSLHLKHVTPTVYHDVILSLYCNDSTLYIGTTSNIVSIDINKIQRNDEPPPVYITFVKSEHGQVNMPLKVDIPYRNSRIIIGFVGISYTDANLVEYRYKIQGLDNAWHITTNSTLEIPSMPSGNYTFLLCARKNKGTWGKPVALALTVVTPMWKSAWFIIASGILSLAILFSITRRQTIKQESKKRKQLALHNRIVYLKQQALSALINPHFIFNCMNSIQHYLDSNDNDKANSYLADFASLIRITMENAQDMFIDLKKEVSRLKLYLSLEQLRFGMGLQYEIDVDKKLELEMTFLPNMILQPYIENAIWHGIMPKRGVGKISVYFRAVAADQLRVTILDDGIGISRGRESESSSKGTHYGMKLTQDRLDLLRDLSKQYYTVRVKDRLDEYGTIIGTEVGIVLPLYPDQRMISELRDENIIE